MKREPMVRLTDAQIKKKLRFIEDYAGGSNAASSSWLDPNANISHKNIATLSSEIDKDINIQVNRKLMHNQITKDFGKELADEYIRQLEDHEIYAHDESSLKPYCVSISMYPFLLNGLIYLGGESKAPKHLDSFCGEFINMCFGISAQFAGALATVEWLMAFDHFAKKDYGEDYLNTNKKDIDSKFQQVVYTINEPAAARNYQSIFWNISIFDRGYFEALFGDFVFPDNFEKPEYDSINKLQRYFMKWFNKERTKSLLTFPVVTAAMLVDEDTKEPDDKDFAEFIATELSEGNSFFIYQSDSADSLSSCCRLSNKFTEKPQFSYSLGAGGVATGSINVITININRLVQNAIHSKGNVKDYLTKQVEKVQKYQVSFRHILDRYKEAGLLQVYDAGFINMDKQYLTLGLNGVVEAAEFLRIAPTYNEEYISFLKNILTVFYDLNRKAKEEYGYMMNSEFVPSL